MAQATERRVGRGQDQDQELEEREAQDATVRMSHVAPWQLVAIGAAILIAGLVVFEVLRLIVRPLALLFLAIVIGEAVKPLVERIERWLPRAAATALVFLAVLAVVGAIGWIVLPPLIAQAREVVEQGPELIDRARRWINRWDAMGTDRLIEAINSRLSASGNWLVALPMTLFSTALEIVLVVAMAIYWVIASPSLREWVLSLFPDRDRGIAGRVLSNMGQTVGGYVRAATIDAFIMGTIIYIGLLIIGLDYALVFALLTGIGEFVPIIGPILAAIPAVGLALLDSPTKALIVAGFYLAAQQLESNILFPNIASSQADIPPLLVIFAIFAGAAVGGILGALVAVPLAGALKVLAVQVLAPAFRQWWETRRPESELVEEEGG